MNDRKIPGTIMVVDDTPENLDLLREMLQREDYRVQTFPRGAMALEAARARPPDLILLDIMMPEMNGFEVCERLKADEALKDIPILFMSALSELPDKIKAFAAGGVDYLTKPFQFEEVHARVKTHLRLHSMRIELERQNLYLKETQNHLILSEKMSVLGQLSAGIAHELNTPLSAIISANNTVKQFLHKGYASPLTFLPSLPQDRREAFFNIIALSAGYATDTLLDMDRKKRAVNQLILDEEGIANSAKIAELISDLALPLTAPDLMTILRDPKCSDILSSAASLVMAMRMSEVISLASEKAAIVVSALSGYLFKNESEEMHAVEIVKDLETVLTLMHNKLGYGINLVKKLEPFSVLTSGNGLSQVWINLINNALQGMEYKGTLGIESYSADGYGYVKISDSGPGIPKELTAKIFEPFFTTKKHGEGLGLGLGICRKIIHKLNGDIEFISRPGHTVFTVKLPTAAISKGD
jgi:two-component system, NtrC family, sensor kinase